MRYNVQESHKISCIGVTDMAQSITSADILKELNIKRSTFYYLLKNNLISIPTTDTGRYAWNNEVVEQLKIVLSEPQETEKEMPEIKTTKINNRRYLGNKYKLLDFITSTVARECVGVNTVADIFAGTGSVASAFSDKKLITNDILYFNYIWHIAWFGSEKYDESKIKELICYYNAIAPKQDNYMSLHFANTFFSLEDCRKIGFIREDIEDNYACGKINGRERALLITSLLYAMDKIANTCGHYDAYIKGASFDRHLELSLPLASNENNENNQCYNEDANNLVKRIEADLVYIDPPYNSRQYCDAYHLIENIARWEKPSVFGVAKKMDRTALKSKYCTRSAPAAFEDLIKNLNAKYIVVSYNNMANKGNDRSNARISDTQILETLKSRGSVKTFSEQFKAFTTGKSEHLDNEERLCA